MKKFVSCLVSLIGFMAVGLEVRADTKVEIISQCTKAVKIGDQAAAADLATKVALLISITDGDLQYEGTQCLNRVFGRGWYYYGPSGLYLNTDPKILVKSLAGLSENELISRLANLGVMRESVEQIIFADRIAILEKRLACTSSKEAELSGVIENIDKKLEELNRITNELLILKGTHKACSLLYNDDQSAVMLKQSCINAFQRMGHPNFVLEQSEKRDVYFSQLLELRSLKSGVEEELLKKRSKLPETRGDTAIKKLKQLMEDELEAKSCAEFGYEGVYHD